jgi:hypothetical protein
VLPLFRYGQIDSHQGLEGPSQLNRLAQELWLSFRIRPGKRELLVSTTQRENISKTTIELTSSATIPPLAKIGRLTRPSALHSRLGSTASATSSSKKGSAALSWHSIHRKDLSRDGGIPSEQAGSANINKIKFHMGLLT